MSKLRLTTDENGETLWESEDSLLWLYCPKSHKHNHQLQNFRQAPERRKHGHTRVLKINVVGIKETMTKALKLTEGLLSMLREDITSPYSERFCLC